MKKILVLTIIFYCFSNSIAMNFKTDSVKTKYPFSFYIEHIGPQGFQYTYNDGYYTSKNYGLINLGFLYKINKKYHIGFSFSYQRQSSTTKIYDSLYFNENHVLAEYLSPYYRLGYNRCENCFHQTSNFDFYLAFNLKRDLFISLNKRNIFSMQISAWLATYINHQSKMISFYNNSYIDVINQKGGNVTFYPYLSLLYNRLLCKNLLGSIGISGFPMVSKPYLQPRFNFRLNFQLNK